MGQRLAGPPELHRQVVGEFGERVVKAGELSLDLQVVVEHGKASRRRDFR